MMPYAVRSRRRPKVVGGISTNTLAGTQWRFLDKNGDRKVISDNKGAVALTPEAKEYLAQYQMNPMTQSINMDHVQGIDEFERAEIEGSHQTTTRSFHSRPTTASSLLTRLLRDNSNDFADYGGKPMTSDYTHSEKMQHNDTIYEEVLKNKGREAEESAHMQRNSGIRKHGGRIAMVNKKKKSIRNAHESRFKNRHAKKGHIREAGKEIAQSERSNVIWRPPVKMRIATDLKKETEEKLLNITKREESARLYGPLMARDSTVEDLAKEKIKGKKKKYKNPPLAGSTGLFKAAKPKPKPRPKIGAWYLDVKYWGKEKAANRIKKSSDSKYNHEHSQTSVGEVTSSSPDNLEREATVDRRAHLTKQILDLYIAKAYKAHLKDTMKKRRGEPYRMPYFLKDVDDSEVELPRERTESEDY